MCGIAGFHLKDPDYVQNSAAMEVMVDELLRGIESRGKHATGLVAVTRGNGGSQYGSAHMQKQAVAASDFVKTRKQLPTSTRTVLLHTRFWTKGSPKHDFNNHPVTFGSCFAVHNGAIDNDDELFDKHKLTRAAEVDSEAIPAMISTLGWTKLSEALETLDGVFAIAAVDPVKEPGKLLLAKGQSSPLVVVENSNFIIWASLEFAIRDAWGKVLGTPPSKAAFRSLNSGQAILFDGSTKQEFRFDPYTHITRTTWTPWTDQQEERRTASTTQAALPAGKPEARGVVKDRRIECKNLRDAGEGKTRLMSLKDTYDENDLVNNENVTRWVFCGSCMVSVLVKDMRVVAKEGTICIDCKELAEGKGNAEVFPGLSVVLSGGRLDELESAARLTTQVHSKALTEVVRKSGVQRWVIDYLLWHADDKMFKMEQNRDLLDMAAELEELYQDEIAEAWKTYDWVGRPDEGESCSTGKSTMCRIHSIAMSATEKCYKCMNKGIEETLQSTSEFALDHVVVCPNCSKFMNVNIGCKPCRAKELEQEPTPEQRVARMVDAAVTASDDAAEVETRKTMCCRCIKPSTVFINDGKLARYCSRCFNTCFVCCAVEKLEVDKQGKPNHIMKDKSRVCHRHSRGKEGIIADGQIARMGFEIAFTANYDEDDVRKPAPNPAL